MIRFLSILFSVSFLFSCCFSEDIRVSYDKRNAEISDIICSIATQAQVDVVISSKISGTLTFSVHDTDYLSAFKSLCLAASLRMEEINGIYSFTPADPDFLPIERKFYLYRLKYAELAPTVEKLRNLFSGRIANISGNTLDNTVILYGTEADRILMMKYMEKLDSRPIQVKITARIFSFARHERYMFSESTFTRLSHKNVTTPILSVLSGHETYFHDGETIGIPQYDNGKLAGYTRKQLGTICHIKPVAYSSSVFAQIRIVYAECSGKSDTLKVTETEALTSFDFDYNKEYIIGGVIEKKENNSFTFVPVAGEGNLTAFLNANQSSTGIKKIISVTFEKIEQTENY